jgi:hypothetical protein
MTFRPSVDVKYCGGCNPEIDRGRLVREVKALMGDSVSFDSSESPDLLLLVNGCAHACLDEEVAVMDRPEPRVSVQGARVNWRSIPEADLPGAVANCILEILSLPPPDLAGR